jgi:hypothetical protein
MSNHRANESASNVVLPVAAGTMVPGFTICLHGDAPSVNLAVKQAAMIRLSLT